MHRLPPGRCGDLIQISSIAGFKVPPHDQHEFERLPAAARSLIRSKLATLTQLARLVESGVALRAACITLASSLPDRRKRAARTLRNLYETFRRHGFDWRVLHDKRIPPSSFCLLPSDFCLYWQSLCHTNKLAIRPAYRQLLRNWHDGVAIPGYGTWRDWHQITFPGVPLPEQCPGDLPAGWSRRNLDKHAPSRAALALTRQGIAGARNQLPSIRTDRTDLRPLEVVFFDDVRLDWQMVVGQSPVEINLLVAQDAATGLVLRYGIRPATRRADNSKEKLRLADVKTLLAGLISQYGIPTKYQMQCVVENATAAITEATESALEEMSLGQIRVTRTAMWNGSALNGGFADKATGNPRGKGLLESTFRLFHSEAGAVPGQIGRRYDAGPADTDGRTREAHDLLIMEDRLSSLHMGPAPMVRLPFLRLDEARAEITKVWAWMNNRQNHAMQGFARKGKWRLRDGEPWRDASEFVHLPAELRSQAKWNVAVETPAERWSRLVALEGGSAAFVRPSQAAVTGLLDEHRPVKIDRGEIVIVRDKERYIYRATDELSDRATYLAHFDPADMSFIHLTTGGKNSQYITSLPRSRGIRRTDSAAVAEQIAEQKARLDQLRARVSDVMVDGLAGRLDDLKHNNEVLEVLVGAPDPNRSHARESVRDIAPSPASPRSRAGNSAGDIAHRAYPIYAQKIAAAKQAMASEATEAHARQSKEVDDYLESLGGDLPEPANASAHQSAGPVSADEMEF